MRDDFCAFILTHGRPDKVITYDTLMRSGYTGKVFIVIDDEDNTADAYRAKFGDRVLQFSKAEVAKTFDEGDNFGDRRAIIYARNACFDLARQVGCRYFIELDDDYYDFQYRHARDGYYGTMTKATLDACLESMVDFLAASGATTVAMSQGGDHIGGSSNSNNRDVGLKRKAMNSFVFSADHPFRFFGRVNEDVNAYTTVSRRGGVFFTLMQVQLDQLTTQTNTGGMTAMYLDSGTYVKSFYSVMYCPSAVTVGVMRDPRTTRGRMHHDIKWRNAAVQILHERHRKPGATP